MERLNRAASSAVLLIVILAIVASVFGAGAYFLLASLKTGVRNSSSTVINSSTSNTVGVVTCSGTIFLPCQHIERNESLILNVMYYYYNPNGTKTFDFSGGNLLYFAGCCKGGGTFYVTSYFTVISSVGNVTFGGPNNISEGTVVVYTITPKQSFSGTYQVDGFGDLVYPNLFTCANYVVISIGNGSPDYGYPLGSCTSSVTSHGYQANSQGFVDGFLTFQIVGSSNSR